MTNNPGKTKNDFKSALMAAGIDLPAVLSRLERHLVESKQCFYDVSSLMDKRTHLAEKVALLELELFIEVLKKV